VSDTVLVDHERLVAAVGSEDDLLRTGLDAIDAASDNPEERAAMVDELARAHDSLRAAQGAPGLLSVNSNRVASLLQTHIAAEARAAGRVEPAAPGGLTVRFDRSDLLGWAGSFFSWWRGLRDHRFEPPPDEPDPLPASARLAIVGDFGTGLYGAPVCRDAIAADPAGFDVVIHLGDVYYAGAEDEIRERFLAMWPAHGGMSRALNSNHEMYTGGHAYFDLTLPAFGQSSSAFAFENDHWLVVGVDSAYRHDELAGQEQWIAALAERVRVSGQRVVILSHHPPYAPFESPAGWLPTALDPFLRTGRVARWYWGHQHYCVAHDRDAKHGFAGRSVGHAAFPASRVDIGGLTVEADVGGDTRWARLPARGEMPGGLVLDGPNPYVAGHEHTHAPNGYVTVELRDDELWEGFHAADGTLLLSLGDRGT
jgi:hypothetical protein